MPLSICFEAVRPGVLSWKRQSRIYRRINGRLSVCVLQP
jgi:hypothetical protein